MISCAWQNVKHTFTLLFAHHNHRFSVVNFGACAMTDERLKPVLAVAMTNTLLTHIRYHKDIGLCTSYTACLTHSMLQPL